MFVRQDRERPALLLDGPDLHEVLLMICRRFRHENCDRLPRSGADGDGELVAEHALVDLALEPLRHVVLPVGTTTACIADVTDASRMSSANVTRFVLERTNLRIRPRPPAYRPIAEGQ